MGIRRPVKRISDPVAKLGYEELVEIVRGKSKEKVVNEAYNEIVKRIKVKVGYITRGFYIPGFSPDDISQEAFFALRFKAIPDYDSSRGSGDDPYPFDKFAMLCIRRHLSTILKSSFRNKEKALNTSFSLDQDRSTHDDENLYLVDILSNNEGSVIDDLGKKEYYISLINKLYGRLSKLEKNVFILYSCKYSYDDITDKINKFYRSKGRKRKVNIKSIDNALSRIKIKAKEIFDKYGQE
jgi:RNA polymerase sporulation-specific sigma factor